MGTRVDLTKGPILSGIARFAIPLVLGNLLQQFYTTVDTLILGAFSGSQSLAAVGTSAQPIEVVLCLFLGVGAAVSIIMSQCVGAGDTERTLKVARSAVFFEFAVGVPLTVLGLLLTPALLKLMAVPEDVWDKAWLYTSIVLLGTLGNLGYNVNAGLLRGLGDSKASLWFLVVSTVVNIILDVLLVAVFHMDVIGAAVATMFAVLVSWFFSIWYIRRRFPELAFPIVPKGFDSVELRKLVQLGFPLGLNSSLFSFGHMALQTFINMQGSLFMAAASVSGRINSIVTLFIAALSASAVAYAGQNYGAENYRRLKDGHIIIPLTAAGVSLGLGLLLIVFRMPLLRLFSKDPVVLMYAARYTVVMLLSYWIYAFYEMICKTVNGVGRVSYSTVVNLLMLWAVRVPCAWVITHFFDGTYVMLCYPISFAFGMIAMLGFYCFSPYWRALMAKAG